MFLCFKNTFTCTIFLGSHDMSWGREGRCAFQRWESSASKRLYLCRVREVKVAELALDLSLFDSNEEEEEESDGFSLTGILPFCQALSAASYLIFFLWQLCETSIMFSFYKWENGLGEVKQLVPWLTSGKESSQDLNLSPTLTTVLFVLCVLQLPVIIIRANSFNIHI